MLAVLVLAGRAVALGAIGTQSLLADLGEAAAVAVEHSLAPGVRLPALDSDIDRRG